MSVQSNARFELLSTRGGAAREMIHMHRAWQLGRHVVHLRCCTRVKLCAAPLGWLLLGDTCCKVRSEEPRKDSSPRMHYRGSHRGDQDTDRE